MPNVTPRVRAPVCCQPLDAPAGRTTGHPVVAWTSTLLQGARRVWRHEQAQLVGCEPYGLWLGDDIHARLHTPDAEVSATRA